MSDIATPEAQSGTGYRCQNCGRNKDKLVWMEAQYRDGVIGGYVCLKCVQNLEQDESISNFTVDWKDIKN
jgi:DNA-directed RNA polymerase subunit RPC12/RpoP